MIALPTPRKKKKKKPFSPMDLTQKCLLNKIYRKLSVFILFYKVHINISMGESNTVVSAYV